MQVHDSNYLVDIFLCASFVAASFNLSAGDLARCIDELAVAILPFVSQVITYTYPSNAPWLILAARLNALAYFAP